MDTVFQAHRQSEDLSFILNPLIEVDNLCHQMPTNSNCIHIENASTATSELWFDHTLNTP